MLVEGFKGQTVQDVKKPIQKMMVEKVRGVSLAVQMCACACLCVRVEMCECV